MKGYPKRDLIWKLAQGPRDPRSREYMRGIEDTLAFLADRDEGHETTLANPYTEATAQHDAWFAGNREAWNLWETSK